MKNPKYTLATIAAGLLVLFAAQNMATVELNFLFWSFHSSRCIVIGFALFTGFLIGWAFGSHRRGAEGVHATDNPGDDG